MKTSVILPVMFLLLLATTANTLAQTNTFPATGNVGIGTLAPNSALQVVGSAQLGGTTNSLNIDANGNLGFSGNAVYKVGGNRYAFQYSANGNYGLFFNQTNVRYEFRNNLAAATFFVGADNGNGYFLGNLGLGVTTATAKLDVAGAVKIADGTQGAGKVLTSDAAGLASWQTPSGGVSGGAAGKVAFWTGTNTLGNNTNFSWDNVNGRLGIGVAAPNAPLQLSNTAVNRKIVLWETGNNDHQYYGLGINGNALRYQVDATNSDHVFYAAASNTTSNELMRIKGNGFVGIGNSAPHAPLQFSNGLANRKIILFETANDDHQFAGLGYNSNVLRYQVDKPTADHVFYAAANSTTSAELMRIKGNGNVGIGAAPASGYKLTVAGKIICTELKVQLQPFPDYVFEKDYKLRTLKEVENHIDTYKRLPGMPSAKEVESGGMNVGEMQGKVVEKVEELTLYIIQQQKQIEALHQLVTALQQQVANRK